LKLFFPKFAFIKNKKTGKYAFSLTSLNKTRIFSTERVSEIKKWSKQVMPLCVITNLTQDFDITKNLGKGNFSVVHLGVRKKSSEEFAIKSIDKEKIQNKLDSIESIINEIKTLRKLNHPHIIKLYEVYETELYIHLVFEYLRGGELFDQIDERGIFSEQEAQSLIKSMLQTLKYMHNLGIIHRDLKPENIILQNHDDLLSYKIADFGLSCFCMPGEKMTIRCGSAGFVAPESLNKEGYNCKADIFSLGIISHILLTGIPPFQKNTYKETLMANKDCVLNFEHEMWNNVSIEAKYFIKEVTLRDPEKRPNAAQAIENPWFKLKLKKSESIFELVELSNAIQAKYE